MPELSDCGGRDGKTNRSGYADEGLLCKTGNLFSQLGSLKSIEDSVHQEIRKLPMGDAEGTSVTEKLSSGSPP